MQSYEALIDELAAVCDIIPEYWDAFGTRHVASLETKRAILGAMGMDISSPGSLAGEIGKVKGRPWNLFVEPVTVISVNEQPFALPVYIPVAEGEERRVTLSWSVADEAGRREEFVLPGEALTVAGQHWIDGVRYIKVFIRDAAPRAIGYYFLSVACAHPEPVFPGESTVLQKPTRIIVAPDRCYLPPALEEGKTWGLYANLYAVRSGRQWGIGDFADLKELLRAVAGAGGGFVGINPLHAIPNKRPYGTSPYSPISRLYKNFIYLDMDSIPDVAESEEAQVILRSEVFTRELQELKSAALIDYQKIAFIKRTILTYAFEQFYGQHYLKNTERGRAFKQYVKDEDRPLEAYAVFQALWEHMNTRLRVYEWQDWPPEYHNPDSSAVRDFRNENGREVLFYQYIQWLIDLQHRETAALAASLGMTVGIYHDLAIGSIGGGSNGWSYQNLIAGPIDVGAPPDEFNASGQNWNFPPIIPERLRETGYEFFTDIIRKNITYNGALRIDHALGMFRLFWIPRGRPPLEGAYVAYPVEDLLRIIALESVRNRAVIVAEDLGTVGENVHKMLLRFRMLSYRLLYFERTYPDPSFVRPGAYPEIALCAVTTHDLPTLYGYWAGRDIEVKKELSLFTGDEQYRRYVQDRERDKGLLLQALAAEGLLPEGLSTDPAAVPHMTDDLCRAIYRYLARTPCKLLAVSLDDFIGTLNQQNMPGTTGEYPNWMQRTPLTIEQIAADGHLASFAEAFRENGRGYRRTATLPS